MPEFIIDANLPSKISVWEKNNFVDVLSINPLWDDNEIWDYAKANGLTIITKDKDFAVKQILQGSPPKLIHIKFGNLRLKEFIALIEKLWPAIENLIKEYSIINIYKDRIESIK